MTMKLFKQTILVLGGIILITLGSISVQGIDYPYNIYGILPILLGLLAINMTRDIRTKR
jgi:hypothetical protein